MDFIHVKQASILKEAKHACKKLIIENPVESLHMVDIIQRLGIEHHFEEEIEVVLQKQQLILSNHPCDFFNSHDQLHEVALAFRLLRQGGHYVKPDLFDILKSEKRKFEETYGEDVKGLTALYEASQLGIEEDSLDEVGYLIFQLLHAWLTRHEKHSEAIYVTNTLRCPLHHALSRFRDRSIFPIEFNTDNEWITYFEKYWKSHIE